MVRCSVPQRSIKYLRKHRKRPLSVYSTKWYQQLNQQQAMIALKQQATDPRSDPPHLLSALTDSFKLYNCEPNPPAYNLLLQTLSGTSRFHLIPPVLDHLERVEKFETPEFILTRLIESYGEAGQIQDAVDVFYRIPKFRCVPTVSSLNCLLYFLCRRRENLRMVPEILLRSQSMGIRIEEPTFRILIAALCRIRRVGYAIEILNCMLSDGCGFVDSKICSLILSSLCEQRDLSGAKVLGFFEQMRNVGFSPARVDYANVIKFLVKEGKGMDALDVLDRMKADRIKPDVVCYTMVLSGVAAQGHYDKADKVFDELLVLGLVPDVYTYTVYINALCKQGKVEDGIKMVASMKELGCEPDVIVYNVLLEALYKAGELSSAANIVKQMEANGVGLNLQTYRIMLNGLLRKGEINEACSLLEEMLDKSFRPQSSTIDDMIQALCQRGLVCRAFDLLTKMTEMAVAPGAQGWEAVLLCCVSKLSSQEIDLTRYENAIEMQNEQAMLLQ